MEYYIKDNYYFDIDRNCQFRITGPQNHLLVGLTFPAESGVKIIGYEMIGKKLQITLEFEQKEVEFKLPIVTDIRTLRTFTEGKKPQPLYRELIDKGIIELYPQEVKKIKRKENLTIKFIDSYTDDSGKKRVYGSKILIPNKYNAYLKDNKISIFGTESIKIQIETISNVPIPHRIKKVSFTDTEILSSTNLTPFLLNLYKKTESEIAHLLKTQKTSSFEYGTIFPRDWLESADLGKGDFDSKTIDYMYLKAMKYISETGEAWHEDLVGAYRQKNKGSENLIDRKMIDIEPRYIIGMNFISKKLLLKTEVQDKLRLVAKYILKIASEKELITFKRMQDSEEYFTVGNWRDSTNAFKGQKSPLAPFDVNCIFYPESLKVIRKYSDFFQIKDLEMLDQVIKKWEGNKQKFRMYHPFEMVGYAIALHGKKNKPLPIAHLDEAYDLFYGYPTMEEIVSFALKIVDPDFFYTPVGPVIVANDEDEYSTLDYHGKVIWPKQSAFAVAGLGRQYRRGLTEQWPQNVMDTIRDAILKTCEASFSGWEDMNAVPELYYYDFDTKRAKFYTDQENFEGQMSFVQLWSSVGARRIVREYQFIRGFRKTLNL